MKEKYRQMIMKSGNRTERFKFSSIKFFEVAQKSDDYRTANAIFQRILKKLQEIIRSIDKSNRFGKTEQLWPEEFFERSKDCDRRTIIKYIDDENFFKFLSMQGYHWQLVVQHELKSTESSCLQTLKFSPKFSSWTSQTLFLSIQDTFFLHKKMKKALSTNDLIIGFVFFSSFTYHSSHYESYKAMSVFST